MQVAKKQASQLHVCFATENIPIHTTCDTYDI
jgi:hypothetical protein